MSLMKKKRERDSEVPGGSLADIAFLILIFFMVATTIDMDKGIGQVLPPPSEEEIELNKDDITNVLLDAKGTVFFDGEEIKIVEVKSAVEKMMIKNSKMIFSLKTHEKTKYNDYVKVLDQLKMARAKNISIAQ
jgi:biopolymer transport protein ExbD